MRKIRYDLDSKVLEDETTLPSHQRFLKKKLRLAFFPRVFNPREHAISTDREFSVLVIFILVFTYAINHRKTARLSTICRKEKKTVII